MKASEHSESKDEGNNWWAQTVRLILAWWLVKILLLLWQAPVGVHGTKLYVSSRLQCGRFWALSVSSFREWLLNFKSYPCSMRASWWSSPVFEGEAVKIFLASVLTRLAFVHCGRTGRNTVLGQWPKGVVARLSMITPHHFAHGGTIWFLIAFATKHHWLIAPILSTFLLVTED